MKKNQLMVTIKNQEQYTINSYPYELLSKYPCHFIYQEPDASKSEVKIQEDYVEIIRKSENTTKITMHLNQLGEVQIISPYGVILMNNYLKSVDIKENVMVIAYDLYSENNHIDEFRICFEFKEESNE